MTWRDQIAPLVAAIIEREGVDDMRRLERALLDGRPGWVRSASWQTRIWRDEVRGQLAARGMATRRTARAAVRRESARGQGFLFERFAE